MAETGHARNVANLGTMIAFCIGYGVDYKPTNPLIQIPSLQAKVAPWKNKVTV